MSKERRIKTIERADGKARLFIIEREDGLYRFEGEAEKEELGETFVVPCDFSGLHESAEAAEREARTTVPWLRRQISN